MATGSRSLALVTVLVLFSIVSLIAQASSYVYDANGRLRAVTTSTGDSSEFIYDPLGNILAINSISASQVAVFAFSPGQGAIGSSVTLFGQGFSVTSGANTIKFNGVTASTVTPSTPNQLSVVVPAGASTGTISVTVGSVTATSFDNFVVTADSGGVAPTISSFTPKVVNPGGTVSVTGTHFSTTGITQAGVGAFLSAVTPASDTSLSFVVAGQAGSGPVAVETPYGGATSSQILTVVPASVPSSAVLTPVTLTVNGSAPAFNINAVGKYGAAIFQGISGQWLSLQFSQLTTVPAATSLDVSVYDETSSLISQATLTAGQAMSVHLPQLPRTGTYIALVGARTSTATFHIAVESALVMTATPQAVSTNAAGQSKRVLVTSTGSAVLALQPSAVSTTPTGGNPTISLFDDFGKQLVGNTVTGTPLAMLQWLPGSYSAIVAALPNYTFSESLALVSSLTPVSSATISVDGASVALLTATPGQPAQITFNGTAGQNLSLALGNLDTAPEFSQLSYTIYQGTTLIASELCSPPGCHRSLSNLPATGSYVVTVTPSASGIFSLTATLSTDLSGTIALNTPTTVNLPVPGQAERLTFNGSSGQHVGLFFTDAKWGPGPYGQMTATVYSPDGSLLGSAQSGYASTDLLLQQSGTFVIQVEPPFAATATAQLLLSAVALPADGTPVPIGPTQPGQTADLTFTAVAGQNLSLALTNLSLVPSSSTVSYSIFFGGTFIAAGNCSVQGCHQALTNLPSSGAYTVLVTASPAAAMSFTAVLSTDLSGVLAANIATPLNLTKPGQVALLTFNGSAGQQTGVSLSGLTTNPVGAYGYVTVYNPDGSILSGAGQSNSTTSSGFWNLPPLPTTGTYSVQFEAQYARTSTAQVTFVVNPSASLTAGGSSVAESTIVAGEKAYLTFNGTAGQNLSLVFTNVTLTPNTSFGVTVSQGSTNIGTASCTAAGCHVALSGLPTTGSYAVTVAPNSATIGFTATLLLDSVGTLILNTPYSLSLSAPGQVARLSFSASSGQFAALYLGNVSSTPAGDAVFLKVFGPNGTPLSGATAHTTYDTTLDLGYLAQTGTYTVQAEPANSDVATAQVVLLSPTLLSINGASANVSQSSYAENTYVGFSATAGQQVTLNLTNISAIPSGSSLAYYVFGPSGSVVTNGSLTPPSGSVLIPNAPATGTYTVEMFVFDESPTPSLTAAATSP